MEQDLYAILGVDPHADRKAIKDAYWEIADKCHPQNDPSPQARERYEAATKAWEVLGNDKRRKEYDQRRGTGRRPAPTAVEIANWTPEKSDETARRIRSGRRLGESAFVQGDTYSVQSVTFDGEAGTHPALCCNDEVLETEAGEPTSHSAASPETHKRFAAAHTEVMSQFMEAERKRASWATRLKELRDQLCSGDPGGLGEGNSITLRGVVYAVAVAPYTDADGRLKGQRYISRDGACMEALPETADTVRYATDDDFTAFFGEQRQLGELVEDFLALRQEAWGASPRVRRDLDPGDEFIIDGTRYAFTEAHWRERGTDQSGFVLSSDGHPLEPLPGRADGVTTPRGTSYEVIARFLDQLPALEASVGELVNARTQLANSVRDLMRDLQPGDRIMWSGRTLHVEELAWYNQITGRSGTEVTLCVDDIALNPHFGMLTEPGYRRPSLEEAGSLHKNERAIHRALQPVTGPRAQERMRAEWAQQQQAYQQQQLADQYRRTVRRGQGGIKGRFWRTVDPDLPQGGQGGLMGPPPPQAGHVAPPPPSYPQSDAGATGAPDGGKGWGDRGRRMPLRPPKRGPGDGGGGIER